MPMGASAAWADGVSDAQQTLDAAEERLTQITQEHAKLQDEADDLQVQIDAAVEGVMSSQAEVQEGRARLGDMMSYEYKTGGIGVLKVLLESESLSELLKNLHYVDSVQKAEAEEIERQRQREEAFSSALDDMNKKKDAQVAKIAEAEKKSAEAAQVVSNAEAQLTKAQDDAAAAAEAQRLAALKAQAEALAAEQAKAAEAEPPAEQPQTSAPSEQKPPASNDSASNGSNSQAGGSGGSAVDQGGWKTGSASAYGSTSDGTLGKATASGALVTETSMGVAVPLSWPNARSYLGRQVEISCGGSTVVATVNDLGSMGGGSRSLDLQPGVWKAFGASSCFDWGVRTVSYRFL